jgi:predicted DNA-binding antitoxin AbrB/MazE fold protein
MTDFLAGGILTRMDSIPAIYDAGVFRPLEPVNLSEGTRAEVIPLSSHGTTSEQFAAWPATYFDQTAGALEGEVCERPVQGDLARSHDDETL